MTANDLIKRALRLIGAISPGETPSGAEASDGLAALNSMLSSWSTEGLNIRQNTREVFNLVPGQRSYTFGLTGNFNSQRPVKIHNVAVMDGVTVTITPDLVVDPMMIEPDFQPPDYDVLPANAFETQLEIVTSDQYAKLYSKGIASDYPTHIFAEGTAPLETLNFYPVPSSAKSVVIYSQKALGGYLLVSDVVTLPEGYDRAITYNLALELAPEYGKDPSAIVAMTAQDSKAMIMRLNTEPSFMTSDLCSSTDGKHFNILKGY